MSAAIDLLSEVQRLGLHVIHRSQAYASSVPGLEVTYLQFRVEKAS